MLALTPSQLSCFEDEGYVVVEGVLDPSRDIAPVLNEYAVLLDRLAHGLHRQGLVASPYDHLAFSDRLIRVSQESGKNLVQNFDISLPQTSVLADTPLHVGPAVFRLLTQDRLLDAVSEVVGPEIFSNPVQHLRMKLPKIITDQWRYNGLTAKIPWHQDNGVILPEADQSHILTVWIPLTEATEANGCLQVIPRSHRNGLLAHCPTEKGVAIPDRILSANVRDARSLPMKPGDALLMHQRTVHSSLDNLTPDQVRLSFDLRYQAIGEPTGRPAFPGFIARSADNPGLALRDPKAWAASWYEARRLLSETSPPAFNRWRAESGGCA